MSTPTTYLCYPKPDSRLLPSGSSVVGFERHEDTLAWWEPCMSTDKAYFKNDAYWDEEHCKAAFLAKYPKSPPHPARSNPTHQFFRDYERFVATLACIQGIYLMRAGVYDQEVARRAAANAAAAVVQAAVDELLSDSFLAAWTHLPTYAVRYMGTEDLGFYPDSWMYEDVAASTSTGPTVALGSWGHTADSSGNAASTSPDTDPWAGGGWGSPTSSTDVGGGWGTGGWGTGGWGTGGWAPGWGVGPRPRPQSSRRYASNGRSMGAFFRPRHRRSRRRRIL